MIPNTQRLQSWLRVGLTLSAILGGIFLLRAWVFSAPAMGSPRPVPAKTPASFALKVHYHQRPPYYERTAEGVSGLCATPVARALEAAGIPFEWTDTPPKRQLHLLRQDAPQDCIVGWYRTREREAYARYSTAIYRDQAAGALVRSGDQRIPARCSVAELLGVPGIIMLARAGYSYGGMVDDALARIKPRRIDSGVDSTQWLSILFTRRADFLLITPEEADHLLGITRLPRESFRFVPLTDMPPGNRRYVMFSRSVPPGIVDRFNSAFHATAAEDGGVAQGGVP